MFKKKLLSFICAVASCLVSRHKAFYKCFIAYGAGLGADEGEQHRLCSILELFIIECERNKKSESTELEEKVR